MFLRVALILIIIILLKVQVSCYQIKGVFDDCRFIEDETVYYLCGGRIKKAFYMKWRSVSPPKRSAYSIWTNVTSQTYFVAFHEGKLSKFTKITIENSGTLIHGSLQNGSQLNLMFPEAAMLCFISEIPYVTALIKDCTGRRVRKAGPNKTVIYFTTGEKFVFGHSALNRSVNVLLLVVTIIISVLVSKIHA